MQRKDEKIIVPGLITVYTVIDNYFNNEEKYNYILLEFQTEESALAFQKSWSSLKQEDKDKITFRTINNMKGKIVLRSEFEKFRMHFTLSRSPQMMCGEKVFAEVEKNISLQQVEQKYCFYDHQASVRHLFDSPPKVINYLEIEESELSKYKQNNVCIGCSPSSW